MKKEDWISPDFPLYVSMVAGQDLIKRIRKPDILLLRPLWALNCPPFVRQYGILFRKWGVFVCQRDNESTTERRR